MNWDNIDWKKFDCVKMTRAIKDEFDAKFETVGALVDYLMNNSDKKEKNEVKANESILDFGDNKEDAVWGRF